ncbi:unnamed protein product [Adineta steineri]|uniref:DUF4200 domain-containing protein n=1 Tax=Adineta steineri TaxID=433720 RepID=A0A815DIW6_9BILA|nr:unnamed protein product [Adineta steineri]CAF3832716.1 unnamed protein product [Adineta steineri]
MIESETPAAEKTGSGRPGLGSRNPSRVTFRDGNGQQQVRSSTHQTEGDHRSPSTLSSPNPHNRQQQQYNELKKKENINPFKFSPDVDFCALSQLDKREKTEERERMQNLKVHDKLSKAQRLMKGRRFRILKDIDNEIEEERILNKETRVPSTRDNAPWLAAITRNRRVENESLQDFIEKKRSMFVLQYELTVKRTEMRKLEEITAAEEQRIEKAEKDLEDDAHMFDQFLAANNKNANEAARVADEEARKKLEKVAEIKRLHGQITGLKSELLRREDELTELKQYKQFLDQITPIEWKEERRKKLKEERMEKQKLEVPSGISDDQASKSGSRPQSRVTDTKSIKRGMGSTTLKGPVNRRTSNSTTTHDSDSAVNKGSDIDTNDLDNDFELYFTDPQQLLEIFTKLEEQNLSLIQNSQDHEEQLEELTRDIQVTMEKKNAETASLQQQVTNLEQAIASEEHKQKELMAKVGAHSLVNNESKQEEYLTQLSGVIGDVYKKIFNENPVTSDPIKNLASIENRLEELFQDIDLLNPDRLQEAEKAKEKERRIRLREQKKLEEERINEEKKRKAALRAKEPPKKQLGRPIAERSRPPDMKKSDQDTINKTNEEEEELAYYFT